MDEVEKQARALMERASVRWPGTAQEYLIAMEAAKEILELQAEILRLRNEDSGR